MREKSVLKTILGVWNTKTVVVIAIGAALFGVLMNFGGITIFTNTKLTTAMIIPVIVGAMFGPVPAFVACLAGNTIADLIGGWGYWFDWSIGNGVLGFIVGLLPLYGAKINDGIFKIHHAVIYVITCVIGNAFAFGVITPLFTTLFYGGELEVTFVQSLTGGIANTLVLTIIGIPILIAFAKRNARNTNLTLEEKE
ncbi:ECF-type riboflavin transporter substrate-binding protein [Anaerocolumna sedimenticola]|uniref:ECF-type riboflavin transporter substrate-binding protein n=1 Tax=Anaerocolumna sedimenticola TaxID=2696063 RepID=A0A6P1TK10_9FIRM|nr:ECF-type riboflavin transporter substrate-binding protein [Anaerocolumna sedimenticola]QHQ59608.1 ECF-type riboflavin transporter substrate-binding protein [Anaerocolumna sedimenticola]